MIKFFHYFFMNVKGESMNKKPVRWPILATGTIGMLNLSIRHA